MRTGLLTCYNPVMASVRKFSVSYEDWVGEGRAMSLAHGHEALDWGRWWAEGKGWDRQRTSLVTAADWNGPEAKTLRNYARVHVKFKSSRARDIYPLRYLEAVCSLPLAQAEALLEQARQNGMKSFDLRFAAARIKHTTRVQDHLETQSLEDLIAAGRKFSTIYADPPWEPTNPTMRRRIGAHYSLMALDDICALPIRKLAAPDAHLHIWTPMAVLPWAFEVMAAWGFTYSGSGLAWVKRGRLGCGNYWRESFEPMLLGLAPKAIRFADRGKSSVFDARRSSVHSEKPAEVRELIEAVSPPPRLELFGRHKVSGWTVRGNQLVLPQLEVRSGATRRRPAPR